MGWSSKKIITIVDKWKNEEGSLLPILHEIQNTLGYVDMRAVDIIAEELNYSRAEVYGTISFYHDFKKEPPKSKKLQICCAEACQAMGSRDLVKHIEQKYQTQLDSSGDEITLEKVYCLGNCACAPSILYQGKLVGRVTPQSFDKFVKS